MRVLRGTITALNWTYLEAKHVTDNRRNIQVTLAVATSRILASDPVVALN